jgi:aromatic-L-amino-acid decarboxylase
MTPDDFRKAGYRVVDWIADYRKTVESRPVMSRVKPGEIRAMLPASPPELPESFDAILADMDRVVAPGLMNWQHPRFFGYFPSNGLLSSVLGDFFSTGLGVIGLAWQSSPALTEVEEVAIDWLRQMLGLSPSWSGVIQDTASTSSIVALLCAREHATNHGASRGGFQQAVVPLTVYVTAQSHSSVQKAALMAGFGKDYIRIVPHDERYAMRADQLLSMIREDRSRGMRPAVVVATIGSTTAAAVDPLEAIGRIAHDEQLWVHVDAAMAGSAMILPECRHLWTGVELADSLIVNPHKWLGAAFDCTAYFVRDPGHLVRVMSTNPSYLQSSSDGSATNYRDWGLPLGRRFRALKLWFLIREQGVAALQARLRRDLANAKWLEEQIRTARGWRVLAPVDLQTLCVRHEPQGLSGEALDNHTLAWCGRLNQSGEAYLTPAMLDGSWMVRVSIGAEQTERPHVEQLWRLMREHAEA